MATATGDSLTRIGYMNDAMLAMVTYLRPQRALILSRPVGYDFKIGASHGLSSDALRYEFVSMTAFEKVYSTGESLWTADAQVHPDLGQSFSLQLSDIRSIVSTPIFHPRDGVWGLLYADRKTDEPPFRLDDLKWMLLCARRLEDALFEDKGFDAASLRQAGETVRPSPNRVLARAIDERPKAQVETVTGSRVAAKPSARSTIIMLRSMGVMFRCGVPMAEIFAVLLCDHDDPAMQQVLEAMSRKVLAGRPLSKAMQSFPKVFSAFQINMVRAGETSGNLPGVLEMLSELAEKNHGLALKIRSALVYPLFLLVVCLGGAILVPPFLLKGQLDMLRGSNIELPLLTKMLIAFSDLVQMPILWLIALVTVVGAAVAIKRSSATIDWVRKLRSLAFRVPFVRSVLKEEMKARFSRALAMGIKAGQTAVPALQQAADVSGDPDLDAEELRQGVMSGGGLTRALADTGRFDSMYLAMVETGEESGRLDELLLWQAEMAEAELEYRIEQFTSILEPLVLLIVGIIVGCVLVATMMPTMQLLQTG